MADEATIQTPNVEAPQGGTATPPMTKDFVGEDFTLDLGELDRELGGDEIVPQVEKKTETPVKVAPKVKDTSEPEAPKTQEPKPQITQPQTKEFVGRDYSQFPEEIASALKKTGNTSFAVLSKAYIAQQEAIKKAQDEIQKLGTPKEVFKDSYDHPEAYILDPTYKEKVTSYQRKDKEEQHYLDALAAIEAGQPFKAIDFDEKGNPKYSDPISPSAKVKILVSQRLSELAGEKRDILNEVDKLKGGYQGEYKKALSLVDTINKDNFPWEKDEKALDTKLSNGQREFTLREVRDTFLKEMVPGPLRGNPVTRTAANLYVALIQRTHQLNSTIKEMENLKKGAKVALEAEPSPKPRFSGAANKKGVPAWGKDMTEDSEIDLSEFTK